MTYLLNRLVLLWALLFLVACESDVVIDDSQGSVDIEVDNAEDLVWASMRASVLAYKNAPTHSYLDVLDFPEGVVLEDIREGSSYPMFIVCDGTDSESSIDIPGGPSPGEALVTFTLPRGDEAFDLGDEYKLNDKVTAVFNGCVDSAGRILNGKIEAKYSKINGLNHRFQEQSTEECVAKLASLESLDPTPIFLVGDSVTFVPYEDNLLILVDQQDTGIVIERNDRVIVVLNRAGVTSLDGDKVYSVVDLEYEIERCQFYERKLTATFFDLSTSTPSVDADDSMPSGDGNVITTLNGSVELVEVSEDLNVIEQAISESSYEVLVQQNNFEQNFKLNDISIAKTQDIELGSLAYGITDGQISSDYLGGTLGFELVNLYETEGADYFYEGSFHVNGRGLESILAIGYTNEELHLRVDYNGDSDNDTLPDVDEVIFTNWGPFLARDFIVFE